MMTNGYLAQGRLAQPHLLRLVDVNVRDVVVVVLLLLILLGHFVNERSGEASRPWRRQAACGACRASHGLARLKERERAEAAACLFLKSDKYSLE